MSNVTKLDSFVNKSQPKPPRTLSKDAKNLWLQLQREYAIRDRGGLVLLNLAMQAYDRQREAERLIKSQGLILPDRHGTLRPHPAAQIARDAQAGMLAALRQLHLDVEPLKNIGRPLGS